MCRGGGVSGGPEALHQLAAKGKKVGVDISIVYYPLKKKHATPDVYQIYDVNVAADVQDDASSLVIVSETETGLLRKYKAVRKAIWWLSIDNYYGALNKWRSRLRSFFDGYRPLRKKHFDQVLHLYQSNYAKEHLRNLGLNKAFPLSDYLNRKFFEDDVVSGERVDAVAYNPAKGKEFTDLLISNCRADVQWVPIVDMTPSEVHTLLKTAKVYVDFGNHPGKDRIPREASISGCCVITGLKGSAYYAEDVSIPVQFKIDQNETGAVDKTLEKIYQCIGAYEENNELFDGYRSEIRSQELRFEREVKELAVAN